MITESIGLSQVEDLVASTVVEDSTLQTLIPELGIVEFVPAPVALKATTMIVPEVPATTQR